MDPPGRHLKYVGDIDSLVGKEFTVALLDGDAQRETGLILGPEPSGTYGTVYLLLTQGCRYSGLPVSLDRDANIYDESGEIVCAIISHDVHVKS